MALREDCNQMPTEEVCPDCYGDLDTVCNACGQHACWEGEYMCHEALSAGTTTRAAWAALRED